MAKSFFKHTGAARSIRAVCGFLFILFCVFFLLYQSHVLEMLQKVLSKGQTVYSPVWGTAILTFVLGLVQVGMIRVTRLPERVHALSYMPSLILLTCLTNVGRPMYQGEMMDDWWSVWIVGCVLFALLVWIGRRLEILWKADTSIPWAQRCWPNVLILLLLCYGTLSFSNSEESFHYETAVDAALVKNDYGQALRIASDSRHASRELSVLRAYALSRVDSLPHKLFAYPQYSGSKGLLFGINEPRTTWLAADTIYRYLGNRPQPGESTTAFLRRCCYTDTGHAPVLDYYLCALLLRKELAVFEKELHRFCYVDESSPRAYLEALYLYYILHPSAASTWKMPAVEQAYRAYRARPSAHRDTYWYYYDHTRIRYQKRP